MTMLRRVWEHPELLPYLWDDLLTYFAVLILPVYLGSALHTRDRARANSKNAHMLLGAIALAAVAVVFIVAFPGPHLAEFGSKLGPFAWIGAMAAVVLVGYGLGMVAAAIGLKR